MLTRSLLALALTGLALPGCNGGMGGPGMGRGQPGPQEEPEERPTPVLLAKVEHGTIEGKIRAASTIEAELQVTVHAESTGRITSLELEEGDEVESGQLLARIRRDAQSLGVERAETNLADMQRELDRVERLHNQGIASRSEYDQAKSNVDQAKLDKKDRRRDLSNTVIKAPFSGILTRRFVAEGGFVTSGAQIFEVTDFSTLVARVYVPEKELDRIAVGQPANIVGKAAKNRQGIGEVRRIAPVVDATTGTVKVTIGLPDALAGGAAGFLPGMYAEVTLTTEVHEDVPIVPKPALIHEEEQTFVFVAEGDRAKKTLIETGLADDDFVEVTGGLEPGARIIVAGQAGLKDGALILEVDAKGQPTTPDKTGDAAEPDRAAPEGPGVATPGKATKEGVAKAG
ncbi:Multidrug resistance protein MdtA precursor [Enhygromyxa salina]|uniref:Multidrug resistance protein MdtA n=1 Tax=Enhygromyxa salina TaxID=215803 RepID=A0A2S9XIV5_9BACT|nr:efflux RND transporter periplasmic adaptor subunit [Enhygromyxa salina]PRP92660.1 Multidrug resistance protein MdtA precursor [Enhygromyxa salina]